MTAPAGPAPATALAGPAAEAPTGAWGRLRSVTQVGKWWASKVGPLLATAYLALLIAPRPAGPAAARLAVLVASACLLATSAYVINDWCDREVDRAVGKRSTTGSLRRPVVVALVVALVVAGVAPWFAVGLPGVAWAALAAIVGLPLVYSAPPVRTKERGWLGLASDAGLAHVAPTVFALATFGALAGADATPATVAATAGVVVWSAAAGVRKIIGHEIVDLEADRAAGARTWVTQVGADRAATAVRAVVLPVEVGALATAYAGLWWVSPWAAGGFTAVAGLLALARLVGAWTEPLPAVPAGPDGRAVLYRFYPLWPALVLLGGLVVEDRAYAWVLVGHLVLFAPAVATEAAGLGAFVRDHTWAGTRDWVRHRAWTWLSHTVPSWFRHRLRPWFTHTVPSWFRYRLPEHRKAARSRAVTVLRAVRHPRRARARWRDRRARRPGA